MAARERPTSTYWSRPVPYGYGAALDGFGSIAAPLLAGFGTLVLGITVALKDDSPVRYPGLATAFVALSVLLLLACVQCSMWARQYTVTPNQIREWWPGQDPGDDEDLRKTQWRYSSIARTWLTRTRRAYEFGILALLIGVAVILVPKQWTASRGVAEGVVCSGVLGELVWMWMANRRPPRWSVVKRALPLPVDLELDPPEFPSGVPSARRCQVPAAETEGGRE
jgi:hypothetical protein